MIRAALVALALALVAGGCMGGEDAAAYEADELERCVRPRVWRSCAGNEAVLEGYGLPAGGFQKVSTAIAGRMVERFLL